MEFETAPFISNQSVVNPNVIGFVCP